MSFPAAFCRRLLDLREAFDLTQEQVAEALGVSIEAYGRLERNGARWVEYLGEIAEVYETTPADLCSYYTGRGRKADNHQKLRVQLQEAAADLSEEDIRSLLDQISVTVKRRKRGRS